MRKTDSVLVFEYSSKVKKACFPIPIFLHSLEQHKKRGLLHLMILILQLESKEQKKRKISNELCARKRNKIVFNFIMALGENFCFVLLLVGMLYRELFVFLKTGHH